MSVIFQDKTFCTGFIERCKEAGLSDPGAVVLAADRGVDDRQIGLEGLDHVEDGRLRSAG